MTITHLARQDMIVREQSPLLPFLYYAREGQRNTTVSMNHRDEAEQTFTDTREKYGKESANIYRHQGKVWKRISTQKLYAYILLYFDYTA